MVMASTGANAEQLIKEQLSDPISTSMLEIEPEKPSASETSDSKASSDSKEGNTRVIKLG